MYCVRISYMARASFAGMAATSSAVIASLSVKVENNQSALGKSTGESGMPANFRNEPNEKL